MPGRVDTTDAFPPAALFDALARSWLHWGPRYEMAHGTPLELIHFAEEPSFSVEDWIAAMRELLSKDARPITMFCHEERAASAFGPHWLRLPMDCV